MNSHLSDLGLNMTGHRAAKGGAAAGPGPSRGEQPPRRSPFVVRGSTVETPEGFKLRF